MQTREGYCVAVHPPTSCSSSLAPSAGRKSCYFIHLTFQCQKNIYISFCLFIVLPPAGRKFCLFLHEDQSFQRCWHLRQAGKVSFFSGKINISPSLAPPALHHRMQLFFARPLSSTFSEKSICEQRLKA